MNASDSVRLPFLENKQRVFSEKTITRIGWLLISLRLVALFALLLSRPDTYESVLGGDARRYEQIASSIGTPYKDFAVEYPLLSYALILLIQGPTFFASMVFLACSQLLLDLATFGIIRWVWGKRTSVCYLFLTIPFFVFPFLYLRIDLLSVFFTVLGIGLLKKQKVRTAGMSLAIAVFAKLWPIALAPMLFLQNAELKLKRNAISTWAITGFLLASGWYLWSGIDGFIQVISFRGAQGWQIESFPGIFEHIRDPSRVWVEQGAWRTGIAPSWGRMVLTFTSLFVCAMTWFFVNKYREYNRDDQVLYGLAPLTCVLALLIFAPILSPQYIIWMLPFVAIIQTEKNQLIGKIAFITTFLSTYVIMVIDAQTQGRLYATLPIVIRNILLVWMLILCIYSLVFPQKTDIKMQQEML